MIIDLRGKTVAALKAALSLFDNDDKVYIYLCDGDFILSAGDVRDETKQDIDMSGYWDLDTAIELANEEDECEDIP